VQVAENHWYPILEGAACAGGRPLALRRFGVNLVLWRDRAGTPLCLVDRCPHRGVRLSLGRVCGDTLECAYHGFRFDGVGRCAHAPALDAPPPHVRASPHPLVERNGYLWLWWGRESPRGEPPWFPELEGTASDVPGVSVEYPASFYRVMESNFDSYHVPHLHRRTGAQLAPVVRRSECTVNDERIDTLAEFEHAASGEVIVTHTSVMFPALTWARTPQYGTSLVVAVSPIDEQRSWFSTRLLHRSLGRRLVGPLMRRALNLHLRFLVLPEDFAIQASQEPADSGMGSDRLIAPDAGIAAYWKMIRAAGAEAPRRSKGTARPG
jgi:nitrite reductase/ring-hydroxylating ferredoxin subunit